MTIIQTSRDVPSRRVTAAGAVRFMRRYSVVFMILVLVALLTTFSQSFLTTENLFNILNQNGAADDRRLGR